ncbi:MAG TPA: hypothetical protein VJH97_06385 [Candidatus Nanoarchaeia archaeon]|nr:hypothetical protein [Candidatus Nanoarchaeia archaeon]
MQKRGQITVFIVLGLLILIVVMYFIFIREKSILGTEEILPELIPVKSYIETCMANLGNDAVTTLGLNGGYLYFPLDIEANPDSYLSRSPTPEFKNPYWWYDGTESIPSISFMEGQLSQYISLNLRDCLNDFEAFNNSYDILEQGDIEVITVIGDSMDSLVDVSVKYPIKIKDKFNKTLAEPANFKAEIPVRLFAAYTMAKSIIDVENAQGFVERRIVDLMTLDESIPDTGGPKFQCGKLEWSIPEINSKIRQLMSVNFPFIKIKGTQYDVDRYVPLPPDNIKNGQPLASTFNSSYYWNHYIWDVGDEDWSNMRVSFTYDYGWPLLWEKDFYIRPNKYPLLQSNAQKSQNLLSFFCMHLWHFTYDIKFPVLVTIVDQETPQHDEYSFVYAFKGSIDHNQARRQSFDITQFNSDALVQDDAFCNDLYNEVTFVALENTSKGWEINDVNLSLVCGQYVCNLGTTVSDFNAGGTPYWRGMTPYCTLGILKGFRDGFSDAQTFVQTDRDGRTYYLYMDPVKEFANFTVVKHKFQDNTAIGTEALGPGESAIIILKAHEKDFEHSTWYPLNETTAVAQTVKLLSNDDYTYDLEIYLMKDEDILGGFRGSWTVAEGDVDKASQIRFHVLYLPSSNEIEQSLFFSGLSTYSKEVKDPELI